MLQFNCEEELWQDSRSHAVWLLNRVPTSKYVPDQPWLTPRKQQFSDRIVTDVTKLQPFGITRWTHIKKARLLGKSDINPREEQSRLVGYDDDQGPMVARIYFPQMGVFELHDNSYICYQTLIDEVELKTGALPASTIVRDPEEYKYLISTRHVDPDSGCTYETTEIKVTPNHDIDAWRKRFYNG